MQFRYELLQRCFHIHEGFTLAISFIDVEFNHSITVATDVLHRSLSKLHITLNFMLQGSELILYSNQSYY